MAGAPLAGQVSLQTARSGIFAPQHSMPPTSDQLAPSPIVGLNYQRSTVTNEQPEQQQPQTNLLATSGSQQSNSNDYPVGFTQQSQHIAPSYSLLMTQQNRETMQTNSPLMAQSNQSVLTDPSTPNQQNQQPVPSNPTLLSQQSRQQIRLSDPNSSKQSISASYLQPPIQNNQQIMPNPSSLLTQQNHQSKLDRLSTSTHQNQITPFYVLPPSQQSQQNMSLHSPPATSQQTILNPQISHSQQASLGHPLFPSQQSQQVINSHLKPVISQIQETRLDHSPIILQNSQQGVTEHPESFSPPSPQTMSNYPLVLHQPSIPSNPFSPPQQSLKTVIGSAPPMDQNHPPPPNQFGTPSIGYLPQQNVQTSGYPPPPSRINELGNLPLRQQNVPHLHDTMISSPPVTSQQQLPLSALKSQNGRGNPELPHLSGHQNGPPQGPASMAKNSGLPGYPMIPRQQVLPPSTQFQSQQSPNLLKQSPLVNQMTPLANQRYPLLSSNKNLAPGQRQYPSVPDSHGQHVSNGANSAPYPGYQFQQNCNQSTNQLYAGYPNPYTGSPEYEPVQPARKLDPDQMPSPIQVIEDDQKYKGGDFITNQKGLIPPLVTTKFTVIDQGNTSPRYIRSTVYTVPANKEIVKQTCVPIGLIVSPMAQIEEGEYEPPIVDMGEIGPVRCHRCKAYMSPFMQFIDAGRRFHCLLCKATSEVPQEYFQHLDQTGQRLDRYERPELSLGTYEFVATKDYCKNEILPSPPAIIFIIDVSYNTVKNGLMRLICARMKEILKNLPIDAEQTKSNMKVGFITYNSSIHFYNVKSDLAQPQMLVVSDISDVFMPLLDGFLCDPEESETVIDSLMKQIPAMFGDTRETETLLAPAIQAGLEALKACERVGKLLVFHSSLPTIDAPGKLKNRDDRKLLGTDKEKTVLTPQTNYYNNLGQDCVGAGCSVDLFIFNNSYVDVSTIGQVCRLTGGELFKYTYFQADIDGERLITDVINDISRPTAFDAVMRIRTSTGIRPTDFYGHFFMANTTDVELASVDCDKAIAIEIKHDDNLAEDEGAFIQSALLYTSCGGQRRLRIFNLSLKTSCQMSELYRACDLDAIMNFLMKQSVFKLVETSPQTVKENLTGRCVNMLTAYRRHCAAPSGQGQLILPECMKLLPLYTNGLLKSDALGGGAGINIDQKSYVMMQVTTMPTHESIFYIYPRLLGLHNVQADSTDLPPLLRCSVDKFEDQGAYLLENGIHMFLWLGIDLSPKWVQSIFGIRSVNEVNTDQTSIPILDNPLNVRIRNILASILNERRCSIRLTITRQRDKMEMVMRQFLVEDSGVDGSPSYVEFLCHMHREIRQLLS